MSSVLYKISCVPCPRWNSILSWRTCINCYLSKWMVMMVLLRINHLYKDITCEFFFFYTRKDKGWSIFLSFVVSHKQRHYLKNSVGTIKKLYCKLTDLTLLNSLSNGNRGIWVITKPWMWIYLISSSSTVASYLQSLLVLERGFQAIFEPCSVGMA
jgi:hypothetical protein